MILEIDEERRRISLGMKQCMPNPWEDFAREYKKGDKVKGQIKSITDFGVFVGLPGGIDGLVHLSDLSWSAPGEEAVKNFKKGEEVEAVVLSIDIERERISLGIKQLEGDPFTNFIAGHEKNSVVSGTVKSVDAKGAVVDIGGVEGYLRASEFARDRVDDLTKHLKEGDSVQAMIINVDRKNRSINLSVKAKDLSEETEAMKQLRTEKAAASAGATNLGALLRAKLDKKDGNPQQKASQGGDGCHDEVGTDRAARPALPAAGGEGRRVRGQDDPRRDDAEPARRPSHRDPRLRQLRPELPAAAHRPQSEVGRKVQVPEKYVPHFKAGKELRERVDSATRCGRAAERASNLSARTKAKSSRAMRIVTWTIRLGCSRCWSRSRRRTSSRWRCASTSSS